MSARLCSSSRAMGQQPPSFPSPSICIPLPTAGSLPASHVVAMLSGNLPASYVVAMLSGSLPASYVAAMLSAAAALFTDTGSSGAAPHLRCQLSSSLKAGWYSPGCLVMRPHPPSRRWTQVAPTPCPCGCLGKQGVTPPEILILMLLDVCPEGRLLNHTAVLFLIF